MSELCTHGLKECGVCNHTLSDTETALQKPKRKYSTHHLFKPGHSGNPGGKPKLEPQMRELARSYTKLAVETLAEMAKDGPPSVRVSAASILLDRGFGKPQQSIQIDVDDGREEMLRIEMIEMRKNPELNAAMLKLAEAMAEDDDEHD